MLFCKHKYNYVKTIDVYGSFSDGTCTANPVSIIIVQRCEKCGRIKKVRIKA
jgi:hypothetical protein